MNKSGDKIADAKFSASKRCKKLLAVADLITEKLKGQEAGKISINPEEILKFFAEEKEKDKIKNRISIVLNAVR
ncbi:MAG: iron-sulfur cluster assembly scaffold protein [Persephonella sp.]|nr:iron-sulfur cluster assembly scaffold protein [Persephonella sp.]